MRVIPKRFQRSALEMRLLFPKLLWIRDEGKKIKSTVIIPKTGKRNIHITAEKSCLGQTWSTDSPTDLVILAQTCDRAPDNFLV